VLLRKGLSSVKWRGKGPEEVRKPSRPKGGAPRNALGCFAEGGIGGGEDGPFHAEKGGNLEGKKNGVRDKKKGEAGSSPERSESSAKEESSFKEEDFRKGLSWKGAGNS